MYLLQTLTAKFTPKSHPKSAPSTKRYDTFEGVFKPTLLTILGVIMYLRVGWVVGNAGLLGGVAIILIAVSITFTTGLSIASIATNTRLKAGGPYAMISKSLGIEVGGAIGLPLFLSQALAVVLYIFGCREGWLTIFPTHSPFVVDLCIFGVVFAIAYISAELAFRVQYLVMVLIGVSLISIFASPITWQPVESIHWWGDFVGSVENNFSGINFWQVFAVFFPATTGIMSGVNMSGELKNSRTSIPVGTLSAIGVSTVIYLALCWWTAQAAPPQDLVENYTILVDKALWGPAVLGGLLAATLSAALSSLVGAPRILMALGGDNVLPNGQWVAKRSADGEPRRALVVSGLMVLGGLFTRDLNVIAPLITMFFLLTYATVNLVVLLESSLGLMNFRPTLRLPRIIPLYGLIACLLAMVVINPGFSVVAIIIALVIYIRLASQPHNEMRPADVRSGIFVAIAQWAASKVVEMDMTNVRAWKPNVLVPIEDQSQLLGEFRLLLDFCQPEGIIKLVGLASQPNVTALSGHIRDLSAALRRRGVFTTFSIIDANVDTAGIIASLQALQSDFFRPNVLFVRMPDQREDWNQFLLIFDEARRLNVGVMLFGSHPEAGLGRAEVINLWITPQLDQVSMPERLQKGSINLALLMGMRLAQVWKGQLNLISVVPDTELVDQATQYIEELRDLCRVPSTAKTIVRVGQFEECMTQVPQSDIDFLGLASAPDFDVIQEAIAITGSSCIFVRDSGSESALA